MLEKFEKSKSDKLILLGDILYHGPRNNLPREYNPKSVIDMLNPYAKKILCVRGNCDTEVDQMVLKFPLLADYGFIQLGDKFAYLTHGHHIDEIPVQNGDIVISGHTHIPRAEKENECLFLNPGSVSIPKENSPHSYITFENGAFLWKDIENGNVYLEYKI